MENWFGLLMVWGGGIYAHEELGRVSGARFMWPCTIGQGRDAGRSFLHILKGYRVWCVCVGVGKGTCEAKQGVKLDNCQGNKYLLGGGAGFMAPGREEDSSELLHSSSWRCSGLKLPQPFLQQPLA